VESAIEGESQALCSGRRAGIRSARSDGWRVYDCQAVGVNLSILGGLGINESDAQTPKREESKSRLAFRRHFREQTRRKRDGFSPYLLSVGDLSVSCRG
jgi:hypothetical protein